MKQGVSRHARIVLAAMICAALLGAAAVSPPAAAPKPPGSGIGRRVLVIPIEGEINSAQGAFLHRVLDGAEGEYDVIILDIDTPGGRIDIMSRMSDDILRFSPKPVPKGERPKTIAFVRKWALSAGSFIAMSCDRIYMRPTALIGAARGYIPGPGGVPVQLPASIEEKFASVNRAQFRALAETKGYPPAIAEAMTDENLKITKIESAGKVMYVTAEQLAELDNDPLKKDKIKIIEVVSPKGKLITLTASEAVKFDLATKIADDIEGVLREEGLEGAEQVRQAQSTSDKIIAVVTARPIVSLLILIGFGAFWLEFKMPGFGVAGTIGVLAFLVVFSSQFLIGNANALEIMLFLIGLALLAIELFVTPGFGFIGGAGLLCLFVSLVLAMQPFAIPDAPWQFRTLRFNLLATLGGVLGSFVVLLLGVWLLPSTPLFARLALQKQLKTDEGYGSGVQEGETLVGQVGVVVTALRPAGKLEIGDKTYSVVSDAEFVDAGGRARVIRVDGPKIVVEPVEQEEPREPEFDA